LPGSNSAPFEYHSRTSARISPRYVPTDTFRVPESFSSKSSEFFSALDTDAAPVFSAAHCSGASVMPFFPGFSSPPCS